MENQNQSQRVISFLSKKGYITADLAKGLKVKNLRARICELRKSGHNIQPEKQERLKFVNSKGQRHMQKYTVAKYVLQL
jgi:hypothetical protein